MLVSIGRRSRPEDLVGVLSECHERIRTFARLAQTLGRRDDLPEGDVRDAARRCERYFSEALPQHVEDEEQSVLPRLRGRSPELDAALADMHAQHASHLPQLADLLVALRALGARPSDGASREALRSVADALVQEFDEHLALEERVIFPAVRALLSGEEHAQVRAELRARRSAESWAAPEREARS